MNRLLLVLVTLVALATACGVRPAEYPGTPLAELRRDGPGSDDPEYVGQWLLSELISPGGEAKSAQKARKHLDDVGGGRAIAHLARALDDEAHGQMRTAPDHYLRALRAARSSSDPRAPFIAWFSASRAVSLRGYADGLWKRWRSFVEEAMAAPLAIGWRARGELVEWWADEAYAEGKPGLEARASKEYGCVGNVRFAGPFGHGAARDTYRSFPAERPGPWPSRWKPEPGEQSPRVIKSKRDGCFLHAEESGFDGIFYAETFLDLKESQELVIAIQGALAVFIDDEKVLDRDPRRWGVWPKFGTQVFLERGRHRVVARLADAQTSIRVLTADGRPAHVATSSDSSAPYSMIPPEITGEPNVISRYIAKGDVTDPEDDVLRFLSAYLAFIEGQGDVAAVFAEPLLKDTQKATGYVLERSALFAERDPIFDQQSVRDLTRELQERAVKRDPRLWQSQLALALWQAERAGASEAVRRLEKLSNDFPNASGILLSLARAYGELGWNVEYQATAKELAKRFPEDVEALTAAANVYDTQGDFKRADELVERIRRLDPDNEVTLTRAIAREDYDTALRELKRMGKRRPERKDIADRIYDVMVRSGNQSESWKKLDAAVSKAPLDGAARLALADAHFAGGKHDALRKALVDALTRGADSSLLE
jgi:tetratricopeptide (TPR) repeat protein